MELEKAIAVAIKDEFASFLKGLKEETQVNLEMYSVKEVAKLIKTTEQTIYKLIHTNRLRCVNLSNSTRPDFRIPATELERFQGSSQIEMRGA